MGLGELGADCGGQNVLLAVLSGMFGSAPLAPGGAHRRSGSGVRDLGVKNQENHSPSASHSFFGRGTPGPLIERCGETGGL